MDITEIRMHHRAGLFYGEDSTCYSGKGSKKKPKTNYKTEDRARQIAIMMGRKWRRMMEGYPCCWCGGWHIGRRMDNAERERFTAPDAALDAQLAANPVTAAMYGWTVGGSGG